MQDVISFLKEYDTYFILGLSAFCLILFVYAIVLSCKLAKISKSRSTKLAEGQVGDIADCLTDHADTLTRLGSQIEKISSSQVELGNDLQKCLRKIGIVRFNAFDDVGGEQSFALALLDASKSGVIISNLYGRQDSRLYAKSIVNGNGERTLSDEERNALEKALV